MRAVVVFASSARDEAMPSKDAIREVQQQARAGSGAIVSAAFSFITPVGRATQDNGNSFAWSWMVKTYYRSRSKRRKCISAHGVCSHEGRWTPEGRGNFAAATRLMLLVSHGNSRDRIREAISTLHGL